MLAEVASMLLSDFHHMPGKGLGDWSSLMSHVDPLCPEICLCLSLLLAVYVSASVGPCVCFCLSLCVYLSVQELASKRTKERKSE